MRTTGQHPDTSAISSRVATAEELPAGRPADRAGDESGPDLDRESPLPLYAQLKRRLEALIRGGTLPDQKFYSDQELCAMFGVSRFTVRQAVQELVAQGVLRRIQGQGTFVNTEKFDEIFGPQMDFKDQWARSGHPLSFELNRFEIGPCPEAMAGLLGVGAGQGVLHIERVRRTGGTIASYDFRYIHPDLAGSLTRAEAVQHSLLDLLGRRVGLSHATNRLEAALAGVEIGGLLGVDASSAVMIRELAYYGHDDLPVMVGRSYTPGHLVRHTFTVALSPQATGAAAAPFSRNRMALEVQPHE